MTTCLPTRIAIRAQAKLNLWLRVLAREASGYHSIETLFHRIELADEIVVTLRAEIERSVECSEDVGPASENLAFRAAELYCWTAGWPNGFHISITKQIPARGGLGGGSADAAAVLIAFNEMAPNKLPRPRLAELGASLGADVPFLLSRAPAALAWSHGDRLLALPALPQRHVALVIPDIGISTAAAYASFTLEPALPETLTLPQLSAWEGVIGLARNDLSRSDVAIAEPAVARCIAELRAAGAVMAEMTGSGSVVFGIFESRPDPVALECATGCRVVLTRTSEQVDGPLRLE